MKTMPTRVRRNTKQTIPRKMLKPIAMKPEICALKLYIMVRMVGISSSLNFNLSLKSIIVADRFPHPLCSCCQWLSLLGKLFDYKQIAGDGDNPNRAIHRWPKDDMFLSMEILRTHPFVPVRQYRRIDKATSNCVFISHFPCYCCLCRISFISNAKSKNKNLYARYQGNS